MNTEEKSLFEHDAEMLLVHLDSFAKKYEHEYIAMSKQSDSLSLNGDPYRKDKYFSIFKNNKYGLSVYYE